MILKYCSGDFKYDENIYDINRIIIPSENVSVDDLKKQFMYVVEEDIDVTNGIVPNPFGYPNLLVIDASDENNIIVRAKNDRENLIDAKPQKIEEIKRLFENALSNGCFVNSLNYKVDCQPEDIANWTSTLKMIDLASELGNPLSIIPIADYDNNSCDLTVQQFKIMCIEVGQYFQSLMSKKWKKRDYIEKQVTSMEQLNLITWDSEEN